ncbi:desulfoferrodoxin [Candidatus Parcubacteria bacterium]|nr:MAG: desulfoferrodoxin [Candidatus Parcubacteria bacterium]
MTQQNQIYKCEACGNIVEVLHIGPGQLVCCGAPMGLMEENTVDAAVEKHVPVIKKTEDEIIVRIGEVDHPMEEAHFIEWIEIITPNKVYRKNLKPGDLPTAKFKITATDVSARAYCNLHGLWKK